MTAWIIGISGTLATGLLAFIAKKVYDVIICRNEDHKLMRQLPKHMETHKKEHAAIKELLVATQGLLAENKKDNMELQKRQLLDSYERAHERGYWSVYEKQAWLTMYDRYRINDGNSFIQDLAENEIDKIRVQ